jgi:hypothetical protein
MKSYRDLFRRERDNTYKHILDRCLGGRSDAYDVWDEIKKENLFFMVSRQVTQNIKNRFYVSQVKL